MSQSAEAAAGRDVVVVCHEDVPGGATLSVVRLAPVLEELGWRPWYWVSRPSPLFEYLRERGLRVEGAPRPIAYSLSAARLSPGVLARARATPRYLRAFRAMLRERSPALVHANSLFTLAEAWTAARAGIPIVFHVHEMLPDSWKRLAAKWIAQRLPGEVVAVSEAVASRLELNGRRPRVVHEGAIYPPVAPERPARDRTVVGTVGVISRRKGSDLFVEAAARLRATLPEVQFRMIGAATDPLERRWAEAVLRRASAAGVEHAPRADVDAALASWDVFVLPSRRDPCPISLLEAMGSGLAVVASAVDGILEQVAPGCGLLVPPDDVDAIVNAIVRLHSDRGLRSALGTAARERVLACFSLERQAAGIHEAYLAALESGPPNGASAAFARGPAGG